MAKANISAVVQEYDKQVRAAKKHLAQQLQLRARRAARQQGLVRTGRLLRSIVTRQKRGNIQVGTTSEYANIYNFGGTVVQRAWRKPTTKRPRTRPLKGIRRFKVRRRSWISEKIARPALQAAKNMLK